MRLVCCLLGILLPLTVSAQESEVPRNEQIIVTAPGGAIDLDNALTLERNDIWRTGSPDLLATMTRDIAGVTLQDAQGNPWQPNLVYRVCMAVTK